MLHLHFSTGLNIVSLQDNVSLPITASGGTDLCVYTDQKLPLKNTMQVHIYWDPKDGRPHSSAPRKHLIHKDKEQTDSRSDATPVLPKQMNSSSFLVNRRNTQLY